MNASIDDPSLGLRLPEGPVHGAALVIGDGGAILAELAGLRARGVATLRVERLGVTGGLGAAPEATDDGAALALVDEARVQVAGELGGLPVWAVGVGHGATVAMMALGAIPGLTGAIALDPLLVYPGLDPRHPAQPLDLLPGVNGPLQVHLGRPDGDLVRDAHVAELRARLGARATPWWVFDYAEPRGFAQVAGPATKLAWSRALRAMTAG